MTPRVDKGAARGIGTDRFNRAILVVDVAVDLQSAVVGVGKCAGFRLQRAVVDDGVAAGFDVKVIRKGSGLGDDRAALPDIQRESVVVIIVVADRTDADDAAR